MMYAVYANNYGIMRLAEDGFASYAEAAEYAANQFGLADWRVIEYNGQAPLEIE